MMNTKTILALSLLICISLTGCEDNIDDSIHDNSKVYLLDRSNYDVLSIDAETEEEIILGRIFRPEFVDLDLSDNTNSNLFIDQENKRISASGWKEGTKYFFLFDYEKGNLIDSLKLSYPFTNRYFYSPEMGTIYSYRTGTLFSMNLDDKQVQKDVIIVADSLRCGVGNQGINNFDNEFYDYGCFKTTIINLKTKTHEIIQQENFDPNCLTSWISLFSVGLSKDHSYLLGFDNYQRHFPDDPNYTGNFDSVRNELYMVKKNLVDDSCTENQIDLSFGENNGYFNSEMEQYFLKHNDDVIILNSDLTVYKTISTENMSIIKQ